MLHWQNIEHGCHPTHLLFTYMFSQHHLKMLQIHDFSSLTTSTTSRIWRFNIQTPKQGNLTNQPTSCLPSRKTTPNSSLKRRRASSKKTSSTYPPTPQLSRLASLSSPCLAELIKSSNNAKPLLATSQSRPLSTVNPARLMLVLVLVLVRIPISTVTRLDPRLEIIKIELMLTR